MKFFQRPVTRSFASSGSSSNQKPVSWGMVAATAVASLILVTVLQNQRSKQMVQVKEGRVIGRPKLGGSIYIVISADIFGCVGPYDLIDSDGKACTDERFRGKYQLIYFGFINCPDICPTELRYFLNLFELIQYIKAAKLPCSMISE